MNTLQAFLRLRLLLINIFFNVTTFELLNIKSKILLKMYLNEKAGAFDRKKKIPRKGNPLTLLVGMQTSTATMENCGDFLKNWK